MKIPGKRALKLVREKESDEFAMRDKRARSEEARIRCTGKLRGPSRMYVSDASRREILIGFVRPHGMRTTDGSRVIVSAHIYARYNRVYRSLSLSFLNARVRFLCSVKRFNTIKKVDASIKRRL